MCVNQRLFSADAVRCVSRLNPVKRFRVHGVHDASDSTFLAFWFSLWGIGFGGVFRSGQRLPANFSWSQWWPWVLEAGESDDFAKGRGWTLLCVHFIQQKAFGARLVLGPLQLSLSLCSAFEALCLFFQSLPWIKWKCAIKYMSIVCRWSSRNN